MYYVQFRSISVGFKHVVGFQWGLKCFTNIVRPSKLCDKEV